MGFDWLEIDGVYKKLYEELDELKEAIESTDEKEIKNELGDLFFTLVRLARHLDVNPENALRGANRKFIDRFKIMEHLAKGRNRTLDEMTLEELESLWNQAKENI